MTKIYDANNIFAKILKNEIKANKVYENESALAFYDAFPKAKIHVLVIPKKPYINLNDFMSNASENEISEYFKSIKEVVKILGLQEGGYRLINNCGLNGGQEVMHLHFHILGGEKLGKMI